MSVDLATVRSSLLRYEDAFQKKIGSKKPKVAAELSKIDRWLRNELPAVVKGRNPPSILPTDLSDLMKWKLGRGKFRPRLQQLAESNSPELVAHASKSAFELLDGGIPKLRAALDELCVMKGVGPATASLILSIYAPHIAPFMSDEAVQATSPSSAKIDYTAQRYLQYANEVEALKRKLNKQAKADKSPLLSAVEVERALWVRAIVGSQGSAKDPVTSSKEDVENVDGNKDLVDQSRKAESKGKRRSSKVSTDADSSRGKKARV